VCGAANVDLLMISDESNFSASMLDMESSRSVPTLKSSVVYVDGRPGQLRCIAVGGLPPPAVQVLLVPPAESRLPARRLELAESWWVTVGGARGLRVVRRVTELGTTTFKTTTQHDGAELRCSAAVSALPPRTTSVQVVVHCTFSQYLQ